MKGSIGKKKKKNMREKRIYKKKKIGRSATRREREREKDSLTRREQHKKQRIISKNKINRKERKRILLRRAAHCILRLFLSYPTTHLFFFF